MLNTYKLAQGPLGRAMILRIAAVCAALHLLCTFPGGVGGMARVMRDEDAIEWSVINVSSLAMPQCIQDIYDSNYVDDGCCLNCYVYDFFYDCNGGGRISYEEMESLVRVRMIFKILWLLANDYGQKDLEDRNMSRWDAVQLLFEMQKYRESNAFVRLMPGWYMGDEGMDWWRWLDWGREVDVVSDENADGYQMYNGYPAGMLEDIYDKLYEYYE